LFLFLHFLKCARCKKAAVGSVFKLTQTLPPLCLPPLPLSKPRPPPTLYVHIIVRGITCQALMFNSTNKKGILSFFTFWWKKRKKLPFSLSLSPSLSLLSFHACRSSSKRLVRAKRGLHSSVTSSPGPTVAESPMMPTRREENAVATSLSPTPMVQKDKG